MQQGDLQLLMRVPCRATVPYIPPQRRSAAGATRACQVCALCIIMLD